MCLSLGSTRSTDPDGDVLRLIVGVTAAWLLVGGAGHAVIGLKVPVGRDDFLDIAVVHLIGGTLGALGVGLLALLLGQLVNNLVCHRAGSVGKAVGLDMSQLWICHSSGYVTAQGDRELSDLHSDR